jgi:hypothetical protein
MPVSQPLLSGEELEQIPKRYRWLLALFQKFPNPSFPYFVLKRLPWIEGIFWTLIFPIFFLLYYFFSVWFLAFLSLYVAFPLNAMVWLAIPTALFVIFLRIQLERTIVWWKGLKSPMKEWDVSKTVEEFVELKRKQRNQQKIRK